MTYQVCQDTLKSFPKEVSTCQRMLFSARKAIVCHRLMRLSEQKRSAGKNCYSTDGQQALSVRNLIVISAMRL